MHSAELCIPHLQNSVARYRHLFDGSMLSRTTSQLFLQVRNLADLIGQKMYC